MGKLLWISTQTRPDISFDVCQLANRIKSTTENDLNNALKVIKHVQNDEARIKYHNLASKDNLHLVVYADASLANLPDQGSQSGYVIFLANESKQCIPLNWQSKKIKIVRSSLSAETLAFADALDDAVALQATISQMLYNNRKEIPIFIHTDNRLLFDTINSTTNVTEKQLRIDIAVIKDTLQRFACNVYWIPTEKHLANCFTKHGVSNKLLLSVMPTTASCRIVIFVKLGCRRIAALIS